MQTVTVFGARGRQGLAQVRQLIKAGYHVRAVSRQADPYLGEPSNQVTLVRADVDDPASIDAAIAGGDAVFYTRQVLATADPVQRVRNVGEAAKKAGQPVIFNTSSWMPETPPCGNSGYDGTLEMALALRDTGAKHVVIGPVLYMDNLLTNWARPTIWNEGRYVYPHNPELEMDWICTDDAAKFMIGGLERPEVYGERIIVGGPERLKPRDVAAILSDVLGKPVIHDPSTPAQFGWELVNAFGDDMPEAYRAPTAERIGEFYIFNNFSPLKPFTCDVAAALARIPVELTPMRVWAAQQDWSNGPDTPRPPAG